jgi:hypothetical protein
MRASGHLAETDAKRMAHGSWIVMANLCVLVAICWSSAQADDLTTLCADRRAIEKIYYNHRLGEKAPFEQVLPQPLIEQLVKEDVRKEAVLMKVYGVEVTAAVVEAEMQRINATTRAPEMLAEIKAALGNDSRTFATGFVKPILVERLLREKFENDDTLHAPQRNQMETIREILLAARRNGADVTNLVSLLKQHHADHMSEMTWQLGDRPDKSSGAASMSDESELKGRFGPNAQVISSPRAEMDRKLYFGDLPPQLQTLLRTQLRQAGDFSAVVEMPGGFALYLATEKTDAVLRVVCWSLAKRRYEVWLAEQER